MNKLLIALSLISLAASTLSSLTKQNDIVLEIALEAVVTLNRNLSYNRYFLDNLNKPNKDFTNVSQALKRNHYEYYNGTEEQLEFVVLRLKLFTSLHSERIVEVESLEDQEIPNLLINVASLNTLKVDFTNDTWSFTLFPLVNENGVLSSGTLTLNVTGIKGAELYNHILATPVSDLRTLVMLNNAANKEEWTEAVSGILSRIRSYGWT